MEKEKIYAILCYIASMCLYLVGFIKLLDGVDISRLIFGFCLGSAMLCLGGVFLNKMNKKDDDK